MPYGQCHAAAPYRDGAIEHTYAEKAIIMNPRIRKLIGTFIIVFLVCAYAILATIIAVAQLAESHWSIHLLYFAVSGLFWIVPAMFVINWMEGPRKDTPPKH